MKKNLYLIVSICLCLSSNIAHCAQKQTWGDWFKAKFYRPASPKTKVETKSVDDYRTTTSYNAGRIGGLGIAGGGTLVGHGISTLSWNNEAWIGISAGIILFTLYTAISNIMQSNANREDKIDYIRSWIRVVLNNALLYPTRSSKLHVLLKKDDFLQYAQLYDYDKTNILDEVCNLVIAEINKAGYSSEEQERDRQIDSYMAILRNQLSTASDLSEQKKLLEAWQGNQKTIVAMRGYLSIYYRLNNKLEFEKNLTTEQKQKLKELQGSDENKREPLSLDVLKSKAEAFKRRG